MIQVYTGDGKGKTTASVGLAMRAAGQGLKVYICQFIKGGNCGELKSIRKISNIKIERFGKGCFIRNNPGSMDIICARKGLKKAREAISSGIYDLVILDEINVALKLGLIDIQDVLRIIKQAPKKTELVLTGRQAHPEILRIADLISEIKQVRHYFNKGTKARKGIEF